VAHLFRAELQPFATSLQNAIDLSCDLSNKNLDLPLVAESERGADGERSQAIPALCELVLGIRREQRNKLIPEARCINNASR
jgi:hypothetical protein